VKISILSKKLTGQSKTGLRRPV